MVNYDLEASFSTNIYRNFRIKVYGKGYNQLVGIPWLISRCGRVLFHKMFAKALSTDKDKITFKLRRGLQITFYAK